MRGFSALVLSMLLALLLLPLTGCGSKEAIPLFTTAVTEAGHVTETVAGSTRDASVAKEREVHQTLRNRDTQYQIAHSNSGVRFEFDFKTTVTPGGEQVMMYLPTTFTYTESPNFSQLGALPTAPSVNPVWRTTEKVLTTAIRWGVGAYVAGGFFDMFESAWGMAGATYNGDASFFNSNNTAGGDQAFTAADLLVNPGEYSVSEVLLEP